MIGAKGNTKSTKQGLSVVTTSIDMYKRKCLHDITMEKYQQTLYVKTACWATSLYRRYSNALSMGNKLKELVIYAQLQVYELVQIMETCWDG